MRETFASLDPEGPAPFPVDWAGQDQTAAWLDIAREYTEKWHHQQQIRAATERTGLTERRFVEPLIETLLRALPRAYESALPSATDEVRIEIHITDFPGCGFLLAGTRGVYRLFRGGRDDPSETGTVIRFSSDTAWRFLMKGMSAEAARSRAEIRGPAELAEPLFSARAVMA